jgi:trans-aconitate methyltransferase
MGVGGYCGFDFSMTAIQLARRNCPDCEFHIADVFETELFRARVWDAVICTEVLEHLTDDLGALNRISPGTLVLGTVPSFDDPAHVRRFAECSDVERRYGALFARFRVDAFAYCSEGTRLYLFEGIKH